MAAGAGQAIEVPAGRFLCLQGESVDSLYTLSRGVVRVVVNAHRDGVVPADEALSCGRTVSLIKEPGTLLGEAGIFLARRSASLLAHEDCEFTRIPITAEGLDRAIERQPEFGLTLARALAQRLRSTDHGLRLAALFIDELERNVDQESIAFRDLCVQLEKRIDEHPELGPVADAGRGMASFQRGQRSAERRSRSVELANALIGEEEANERCFADGELVCAESQHGEEFFIVLQGQLRVRVAGRAVATLGEGEIFGEIAVLLPDDPRRSATVESVGESKIAVLEGSRFDLLARRRKFLLPHLTRRLASRLAHANRSLCDFDGMAGTLLVELADDDTSCEKDFARVAALLEPFRVAASQELSLARAGERRCTEGAVRYRDELEQREESLRSGGSFNQLRAKVDLARVHSEVAQLMAELETETGLLALPRAGGVVEKLRDYLRGGYRPHVTGLHDAGPDGRATFVALIAIELAALMRASEEQTAEIGASALLMAAGRLELTDILGTAAPWLQYGSSDDAAPEAVAVTEVAEGESEDPLEADPVFGTPSEADSQAAWVEAVADHDSEELPLTSRVLVQIDALCRQLRVGLSPATALQLMRHEGYWGQEEIILRYLDQLAGEVS